MDRLSCWKERSRENVFISLQKFFTSYQRASCTKSQTVVLVGATTATTKTISRQKEAVP